MCFRTLVVWAVWPREELVYRFCGKYPMPYAICTRSYVLSFKQILIAKKYMKSILPFDVKTKHKKQNSFIFKFQSSKSYFRVKLQKIMACTTLLYYCFLNKCNNIIIIGKGNFRNARTHLQQNYNVCANIFYFKMIIFFKNWTSKLILQGLTL